MNKQSTSQPLTLDFPHWPPDFANRYRHLGYWQDQTFGQMLRHQAKEYGERLALVGGDQRWSYRELDLRADQLAAGFKSLGILAGDRIVIQLPNIPEFFAIFFALSRLGALPVLALPAHRQAEIQSFLIQTNAVAYIIVNEDWNFDYRGLARQVQPQCKFLQHVVVVGEAEEFHPIDRLYLPATTLSEPRAEDVAFFQLSGGSTGLPKLIPRTHADYLYSVRISAEICHLTRDSVYLVALPVAHNFPLSSPGSLGTLYAGGQVVLAHHPNPDDAFVLIAKEQVTITALVPPLVLIWLEATATRHQSLSSLQVLQVGGAKLSFEVAKRITSTLGCQLQQVFGMAEGLVCYTRLDDSTEITLNTQGRPLSPADEIRVVDDYDQDVLPGEVGNLLTRGPYTIRAYYQAPEQNRRSFTSDGFYRTGDRVRLNPSGYVVVEGRAKDQINRGGEKISSEEVENNLLAHPAIYNAAVIAIPDPFLGEAICACLMARNGAELEAEQMKGFLRGRGLATYKIPDRFIWLTVLPQTGAGKVDKKTLQTLLSNAIADL
ncbi:(2,3-dihydroxybenzoyl)adenylate synthase (plasmid) [Acaryochloris sp. 'Moss Beach']|uniref:(2,3-dihydroxybenzoyl)adenylate synthase n=1 Tax=Acaryochloris sp. 'Moss Beach' TaxID=2740837 RepID=UPI001F35B082|nr:(2,3-dihydroxybenzoyl)adenylate synthase [Acaryochloris sp. 'Moss Beach']UJB72230.1 (2,3-dihydroxybenzoyl)adenylate synthase [Acaryochloris sp. 'Moss Beach']